MTHLKSQSLQPPPTRIVDNSDTYFGVTYKDLYRWLENTKSPEVEEWFRQQSIYANAMLENLRGRDELVSEWKMLDKLQQVLIRDRSFHGGHFFHKKRCMVKLLANTIIVRE